MDARGGGETWAVDPVGPGDWKANGDLGVGLRIEKERRRERFPSGISLSHVVEVYWPNGTIVDPGGVLLCHDDELRGKRITGRWIVAPHDRTTEMSAENCLELAKKSDTESRGNIPSGHASPDVWKRILALFHARRVGPISALFSAIDLPNGLINAVIRVVDVMGGKWAPAM